MIQDHKVLMIQDHMVLEHKSRPNCQKAVDTADCFEEQYVSRMSMFQQSTITAIDNMVNTSENVINCCGINYTTDEISTRSTLYPFLMIQYKLF